MRPPLQQLDDQLNFMDFSCACMTLYKFISWPETCRGQVGLFSFLLWLSSEGFAICFEPTFCIDIEADCCISLDWLDFCLGVFHQLYLGKSLRTYQGACRTLQYPWYSLKISRSPGLVDVYDNFRWVQTQQAWIFCCMGFPYPYLMEGSDQGIWWYCWRNRWTCIYWILGD